MGDSESYESFYNGGVSSLEPNYGLSTQEGEFFTGYQGAAGSQYLGFPGSPMTANQLGEAVNAIKQGVKSFEVTMLSAGAQSQQSGAGDQIPKQHFEEMKALMKLSGVKPSLHGPVDLSPAGMGQQGYSDEERERTERRFFFAMEQAAKLKDENPVVVFHSSVGLPGTQYAPGKKKGEPWEIKQVPIVNADTGQLTAMLKEDIQYSPQHPDELDEGHKLKVATPEDVQERLRNLNEQEWEKQVLGVATYKKEAEEIIRGIVSSPGFTRVQNLSKTEEGIKKLKEDPDLMNVASNINLQTQKLDAFMKNNRLAFDSAFSKAYEFGTSEQKKELKQLAKEMSEDFSPYKEKIKNKEPIDPFEYQLAWSAMLDKGISKLQQIETPKLFVSIEDFAREKASKTFGNLAWEGYNKLGGEKAPVIAIENMFAGEWAHSTAEGLKNLIDSSQDQFVKRAMEEKKMSEKDAKKIAKKLIGATWDVGHLNILKKSGFSDEDVVGETKKIKDYVKHVHLTDNFGYSDSHLAPGMGNVPIKGILEELEKTGRLAEMSKIVESGAFVQNFKKSPHGLTMAALGSPIYGAKMGPTWNQVASATYGGGYFGSPMAMMPEGHFSTYGSGFSSLPTDLGGQRPGSSSRFSGTANA